MSAENEEIVCQFHLSNVSWPVPNAKDMINV